MNQILVWNSSWDYYFDLTKQRGVDLFEGCEIVRGPMPENISRDPRKKVVVIDWFCYEGQQYDLSWADLVICFTREVIDDPWSVYLKRTQNYFNCKKIIAVAGGIDYTHESTFNDSVYYPALCFLDYVVDCNHVVDYSSDVRPYIFDALLGGKKPSRKYIFKKLEDTNLLDSSIVSLTTGPYDKYYDRYNFITNGPIDIPDYTSPILELLEDPDILKFKQQENVNDRYSANMLSSKNFKGSDAYSPSMSFVIPDRVYQNSWYSIVSETHIDTMKFITEKTAKCLYAKRIFVCFGSKGHLEFLRKQGFRTFHGIIDESYDSIDNPTLRFQSAWQQIEFLSKSNPLLLYEQAQEILEHNYLVINDINSRAESVKKFIFSHLNQL